MDGNLFPVQKNGKSGFIDKKGDIVIDFKFDFFGARNFNEGLAAVSINGKSGYIDSSGQIVIEPAFGIATNFCEGLAVVEYEGKYGYIDKKGNWAIQPKFYFAEDFNDGLAQVKKSVTCEGVFINKTGKIVLKYMNFLLSKYREGLINCPGKGGWGFIDKNGDFIIKPKYQYTSPFYENKAAVVPKKDFNNKPNRKEKYCFINHNAEILFQKLFEGADIRYSEGLCAVYDNGYGFIDDKGEYVIPCDFYFVSHFSDGLARFRPKGKNKKYGFIDTSGNVVIEPVFTSVKSFKNGLAQVIIGDEYEQFLYGYIDKQGNYIWEPSR